MSARQGDTETHDGAETGDVADLIQRFPGVPAQAEWQPLPARAWWVFQWVGLSLSLPIALVIAAITLVRLPYAWETAGWLLALGVVAGAAALSHLRHRTTFWKLDAEGFAVRRGRVWQWDTRVPLTRVQHLDVKRGPLERLRGLASLVVHTAGTRLGGVTVSGVDAADAERVRDLLARAVERANDDD